MNRDHAPTLGQWRKAEAIVATVVHHYTTRATFENKVALDYEAGKEYLSLNGVGDEGCEDIYITRLDGGPYFVKTNQKPYDKVIKVVLYLLRANFPDWITSISCDSGNSEEVMEKAFSDYSNEVFAIAFDPSTLGLRAEDPNHEPNPEPDFSTLLRSDLAAIRDLRDRGFAVVVWTPEELGTASPEIVEDRSSEFGHGVIEASQED